MQHIQAALFFFLLLVSSIFFPVQKAFADPCTIPNGPNLYQINRTSKQATLFFTPINDGIKSYSIVYGLKVDDEKYSITFNYGSSTGAVSYTINDLDPNFQYFFRVRANTSCTFSPWSAWVGDKHTSSSSQSSSVSAGVSGLPPPGSNAAMIAFLISLGLILSGLTLFKFSTSLS